MGPGLFQGGARCGASRGLGAAAARRWPRCDSSAVLLPPLPRLFAQSAPCAPGASRPLRLGVRRQKRQVQWCLEPLVWCAVPVSSSCRQALCIRSCLKTLPVPSPVVSGAWRERGGGQHLSVALHRGMFRLLPGLGWLWEALLGTPPLGCWFSSVSQSPVPFQPSRCPPAVPEHRHTSWCPSDGAGGRGAGAVSGQCSLSDSHRRPSAPRSAQPLPGRGAGWLHSWGSLHPGTVGSSPRRFVRVS